jgi:putative membrane protein
MNPVGALFATSRAALAGLHPKAAKGVTMDTATRKGIVAFGLLLVVALALSSTMGGMMRHHMMGPGFPGRWDGWMWGAGMWLGALAMLIFWGALIAGAILIVRLVGGLPSHGEPKSPSDILKHRYASGEITREQYEQIRKDLEP